MEYRINAIPLFCIENSSVYLSRFTCTFSLNMLKFMALMNGNGCEHKISDPKRWLIDCSLSRYMFEILDKALIKLFRRSLIISIEGYLSGKSNGNKSVVNLVFWQRAKQGALIKLA